MNGAPLIHELAKMLEGGYRGFHMPGHQQGAGMADDLRALLRRNVLGMDLTEIPGLDNLKDPQGCLKESQSLAARVFGARRTFYLINGSSVGLQAALLATNPTGRRILIPRHAHLSVINGLVLTGGRPVMAPAEIDPVWGIPLGTDQDALVSLLENDRAIETVLLTQPTYYGVGLDAGQLVGRLRKCQATVIADEAHGAHLYFQDAVPLSTQQAQADIVVHSTHISFRE